MYKMNLLNMSIPAGVIFSWCFFQILTFFFTYVWILYIQYIQYSQQLISGFIQFIFSIYSYLVRPSPFSAQKTFERHNSRRKSNISFCSQQLVQQMAASGAGSRRGSGLGLSGYTAPPRPPPLITTKANSLSLPDSPTVVGGGPNPGSYRARSNSLRVADDILLRRSNSLRQGLTNPAPARRKSSLEDLGFSYASNHSNPIKIALNGSIGLEVTPPDEGSTHSESSSGNLLNSNAKNLTVGCTSGIGGGLNSLGININHGTGSSLTTSSSLDVSSLGICVPDSCLGSQATPSSGPTPLADPQHLQGTLV